MSDARAVELCKKSDIVGLLRYLDPMWIVVSLRIMEDLLEKGLFFPNHSRYDRELRSSGVFVDRMTVAMAAVLMKAGRTETNEKFAAIFADQLAKLPEQQRREIAEFWAAGPKPGLIAGTAKLNPDIAGLPFEKYIDLFSSCKYDVNYKVTNHFSSTLQLTYPDGINLEIDIEKDFNLPDQALTSAAARDAMAHGKVGPGGRIWPEKMTAATVPRLWTARLEALDTQEQAFRDFANLAVTGVAVVLTIPAMPAGALPGAKAVRSGVVRRRVPGISRAAAAGISEAEMTAINAVRANPEFAKLTNQEIMAIRSYSGEGWAQINMALRSGGGSLETQATAKFLISGMQKLPGYSGKLIRSESATVADAATRYVKGKNFSPTGMYSTSRGGSVAQREGNIAITIQASGKAGKDITKAAVHGGAGPAAKELEVLYPPGTQFLVEDVKNFGQALMVTLREL